MRKILALTAAAILTVGIGTAMAQETPTGEDAYWSARAMAARQRQADLFGPSGLSLAHTLSSAGHVVPGRFEYDGVASPN